jgi:ATP-dependent helicase/nuclease subunit A
VIDLLFREGKGWVIVDYKTEAVPPAEVEERARGYRDQLDGYAGVWERVTGEKVVERGIFFTTPGRYVPL